METKLPDVKLNIHEDSGTDGSSLVSSPRFKIHGEENRRTRLPGSEGRFEPDGLDRVAWDAARPGQIDCLAQSNTISLEQQKQVVQSMRV
jgi:hypothetical protein